MSTTKKNIMSLLVFMLVLVLNELAFSTTFTVTNLNNDGDGSLRWAIDQANNNPGFDKIEFDFSIAGIISVTSNLPNIAEAIEIDGDNRITLDGSFDPNPQSWGLTLRGNNCIIRGLTIQYFGSNIAIHGSGNSILGNNLLYSGSAAIFDAGSNNTIGGLGSGEGNYVANNQNGIGTFPECTGDNILGNEIVNNLGDGIGINGQGHHIEGNTVAYNNPGGNGILIQSYQGLAKDCVIKNNVISNNGLGIRISGALNIEITQNTIFENNFHGIKVEDYYDGTLKRSLGVLMSKNSIYSNNELGIDLEIHNQWVNPNDPDDSDIGPNNLMNYPVLTSAMATPGRLIVKGSIDTPNPKNVTIELFGNDEPDQQTGYGEGKIFLGEVIPNANGDFTASLGPVSPGTWISATATDEDNNTSEFSLCIESNTNGNLMKGISSSEDKVAPVEFELAQNFPNPFNPETTIHFQLPEASHVTIKIYNVLGKEIKILIDDRYAAGNHVATWNGKDHAGNDVSSGIYFYEIKAGTFNKVMKMSLSR